jgi:Lrp/AsnC family transcriptional regulator for asnA, asnC and gidA
VQRLTDSGVIQIVAVTDPLMLGFRRMAMIGLKVEGDLRVVANDIAAIPEVSYVVVVSGSFDLMMEVVCEDDDHLLALLNDTVRSIPGVRSTESFTYLKLFKQTYAWGTR